MALNEIPTLKQIIDETERLNNLIVNRGNAQTVTPATTNKVLTKGYYKGDITVKGDANLVPANIISGKSIFGIVGSATIASLGGKKWASGSASGTSLTVTGLDFKPSTILMVHSSKTAFIGYLQSTGTGFYCNTPGSYSTSRPFSLYADGFTVVTNVNGYTWYAFE